MKTLLFTMLFTLAACDSFSQKAEVFQKNGAAIGGYDPVAFFRQQKPVKGSQAYSANYKLATWWFASKENRDAFLQSPEKYAPQYGGYCAYGTAGGYKAPTEPDAWSVVDGKLYFNYNRSVKEKWSKDVPGYIRKADANWPKIRNED